MGKGGAAAHARDHVTEAVAQPFTALQKRQVQRYIRRNKVAGWLDPFSAEVIAALSVHQLESRLPGAVAEIGVHHGKLFFVLYLTTGENESAVAIDVFGAQDLNPDGSGHGDKEIFLGHARRFRPGLDGLKIIEDSSLNVTRERVHALGGPIRLFSIDGAHTEEITLNDLRLAEASLADHGLVVLDDVFNEYWPEVSAGLARYMAERPRLAPFAITPGKVFLADPGHGARYAEFLRSSFAHRVDKFAPLHGHEVPILGVTPWTLRRRLGHSPIGALAKRALGRGPHVSIEPRGNAARYAKSPPR
jgi:hypothetical protein